MKKLISLILVLCVIVSPLTTLAGEDYDVVLKAEFESEMIEVGDQFLVNFKMEEPTAPFLTFRINGSFDTEKAEIIAPVYTNEVLGILTNNFSNEEGTFTFEGYDQTIRGTDKAIVCSLLFEAKMPGEFIVNLADDCMLGKANENAFYTLNIQSANAVISEDKDGENVAIIEEPEPLTPFDDMLGYDWAEKAVGVMYKLGALENIADKSYFPGENITRGDFITMMVKICKLKTSKEIEPFNDVTDDSYQYEAIMTAKALNITNGDENNNFRPNETITRQDICALVYRTMLHMNKVNPEIDPDKYFEGFSDGDTIAPYAVEPMAGLIRAKLIIGDDTGLLRPTDNMTRAEAAVLLNRQAEFNILVSRN